jgi:hypothetical protein
LKVEHHAPMCDVNGTHFYIFEPVELSSNKIVIPIYFYSLDSQLYAKCFPPQFKQYFINKDKKIKMKIPQDIQFDDPNLSSINTSEFVKPYADIQIHGKYLSNECSNTLYGIYFSLQ